MKRKRPAKPVQHAAPLESPPLKSSLSFPLWQHAVALVFIVAASVLLYLPTVRLDFLPLDDSDYVINNPHLTPLNKANVVAMLTQPYFANYSPAHLLSYALDAAISGGKKAAAFHLSSVLWHALSAMMVYLLAFTIRAEAITAALAALLFALHPAHVEAVAWISSRKDLVATTFAVLTLTLYLLHRRQKNWAWYVATVIAFVLASAGKQSVALLPAVLLLWDWFVEKRRSFWMLADKVPLGLVTLYFAWRTAGAQPPTRMAQSFFKHGATFLHDLWLLTGLGDYVLYRRGLETTQPSATLAVLVPLAALIVFALPFLCSRRITPVFIGLAAWVFLQLVPPMVLNFVTPVTDRYLFLPSVGLCVAIALGLAQLAREHATWRSVAIALAVLLAAVWGTKTWNYLGEWNDPRSVWFGAKARTSSPEVFENLGVVYQEAGDRIDLFVSSGQRVAITNELALATSVLGQPAARVLEAEWTANGALRTNSLAYRDKLWSLAWDEFESAKKNLGTLNSPGLFLRRGKLLVSRNQAERAIPELEHALQLARTHSYERIRQEDVTLIARALGIAYWKLGRYSEGVPWYEEALRTQRASGKIWVATLENESETLKRLAGTPKPTSQ